MELRTDRCKLKELFPTKAKKYAQKLHKKASEIEFIRKGIPIDPEDIEIKEGERAAIRLITTPHLDRDGEILIPSGAMLDDFRQSPSVLYGHDYKSLPVGSDQWVKQVKEGILAKTVYAKHQFAEDVYQCVIGKHLNSNSVGFIPIEAVNPEEDKKAFAEWQGVLEKDYGIDKEESGKAKAIYTKWIMLEHSDVPVASNAQSLNLAVGKGELVIKSPRLKKDLEIEVVKDKNIEVVKDKEEMTLSIDDDGKVTTFGGFFADRDKEVEAIKEGDNDKKEKEIKGEKKAEAGAEEEKAIITKPETTEKYHRIPVNPGCKITATITISATKGIKALYCGDVKKIHTYLFDVKKFSMEEAKAWVKENHKGYEIAYKELFTKGIKPSMKYQFDSIEIEKESEKVIDLGNQTVELKIMDIPELKEHLNVMQGQIAELKEGRVLSTKNRTLVKDVRDLIRELDEKLTSLLDATEPTSREEEKIVDRKTEKQYIIEKGDKQPDLDDKLAKAVEKVLSGDNLKKLFDKSLEEAVDTKLKIKMGRVE